MRSRNSMVLARNCSSLIALTSGSRSLITATTGVRRLITRSFEVPKIFVKTLSSTTAFSVNQCKSRSVGRNVNAAAVQNWTDRSIFSSSQKAVNNLNCSAGEATRKSCAPIHAQRLSFEDLTAEGRRTLKQRGQCGSSGNAAVISSQPARHQGQRRNHAGKQDGQDCRPFRGRIL